MKNNELIYRSTHNELVSIRESIRYINRRLTNMDNRLNAIMSTQDLFYRGDINEKH